MTLLHAPLRTLAFLSLLLIAISAARAGSATGKLQTLDNTTYSGYLETTVSAYKPPDKYGRYAAPDVYAATVLFERPDRIRLVLRPGAKNEYRVVANAGVVNWLDISTGLSGKGETAKLVDPLVVGLLGSAGELLRFTASKDVVLNKNSKIDIARLTPRTWRTSVESGVVWMSSDGKPLAFEFVMGDRSKLHIAVRLFKQNVQTSPQDFRL